MSGSESIHNLVHCLWKLDKYVRSLSISSSPYRWAPLAAFLVHNPSDTVSFVSSLISLPVSYSDLTYSCELYNPRNGVDSPIFWHENRCHRYFGFTSHIGLLVLGVVEGEPWLLSVCSSLTCHVFGVAILVMRTYALYANNRMVLYLLSILAAVSKVYFMRRNDYRWASCAHIVNGLHYARHEFIYLYSNYMCVSSQRCHRLKLIYLGSQTRKTRCRLFSPDVLRKWSVREDALKYSNSFGYP